MGNDTLRLIGVAALVEVVGTDYRGNRGIVEPGDAKISSKKLLRIKS